MTRRATVLHVLVAGLLAAGCGAVGSGGASSTDSGLLAGVPSSCALLEDLDPQLHRQFADAIAVEVAHGPLVAVDADGATVVAATTYDSPGVEGSSALWRVDGNDVGAVNDMAARISAFDAESIDATGTDSVAHAMAEAQDCSLVAADRSAPDPPEPEPEMRPGLMAVDPAEAAPGSRVALLFPDETARGLAFQLDRRTDEVWQTTHWMTSDANGGSPTTVRAGTQGYGVDDVGVGGPGPDHVDLPADLASGSYRICTANAGEDFCAQLEIAD